MSDSIFLTTEFLLRNAAVGWSMAMLIILLVFWLNRADRHRNATALRGLIIIGSCVALSYVALTLGYFTTNRPGLSVWVVLKQMLPNRMYRPYLKLVLCCTLLPGVALVLCRRLPALAALLVLIAVNTDWLSRLIARRTALSKFGGRSWESWYLDPHYRDILPGDLSLIFGAVFLASCLLIRRLAKARRGI